MNHCLSSHTAAVSGTVLSSPLPSFTLNLFYHFAVVDCGHPGSPPNGVLNGDKFTFGSTVRYSCLGGRQLKGESSRTCQLNGMWSAPMPFCSGNHFTLY